MNAPRSHSLSTVLTLVSVTAALGCASTRPSGPAVDAALAGRPEALVQLRNDGCDSGRCPVYGVAIYADGSVVYRGGANVATVGERRSKIPEANVAALVTALEKMDFIDTPEHCCDCSQGSDSPQVPKLVVDYRPGGLEKEIVVDGHCAGVPDVVRSLVDQIQAVTNVATLAAPMSAATRLAGDTSTSPVATAASSP
jgi:hypothetical protein